MNFKDKQAISIGHFLECPVNLFTRKELQTLQSIKLPQWAIQMQHHRYVIRCGSSAFLVNFPIHDAQIKFLLKFTM